MVEPAKNKQSENESLNLSDKISNSIMAFVAGTLYLIGLAGVCVFGYQVYFWLMHGYWKPIPATVLLVKILPDNFWSWLANDTAWIGLKKWIVSVVNGSLGWFLILFAFILFCFTAFVISESSPTTSSGQRSKPKKENSEKNQGLSRLKQTEENIKTKSE